MPAHPDYYVAQLNRAMTSQEAEELKQQTGWSVIALRDTQEVRLATNLPQFESGDSQRETHLRTILNTLAEKYGFAIISFAIGSYPERPVRII